MTARQVSASAFVLIDYKLGALRSAFIEEDGGTREQQQLSQPKTAVFPKQIESLDTTGNTSPRLSLGKQL
jgi:hypothetical protein